MLKQKSVCHLQVGHKGEEEDEAGAGGGGGGGGGQGERRDLRATGAAQHSVTFSTQPIMYKSHMTNHVTSTILIR